MSEVNKERMVIAGAGPVGALLAVMLGRQGHEVSVYESRPDSRIHNAYQGKSINIALSDRGWLALEAVGIADAVRALAIPMRKRVMHGKDGTLTEQAYGKGDQAIWSVSRSGINEQLLDLAEQEPTVEVHFDHHLSAVDFETGLLEFKTPVGTSKVVGDWVFGADGAHSKVRRLAHDTPRFSYNQSYMPQCYIELTIEATPEGGFKMDKEALHIWPRKDFMLIALPNPDGSFTCTLFLNLEGEVSFHALSERAKVQAFFEDNFADAIPLLQDPINDFMRKRPSPLFLVSVYPWFIENRFALVGDAAHAMVPFYGQGMNCGFEDCRELNNLMQEMPHDWHGILNKYQIRRKENADAITELAMRNFYEMSALAGSPLFLLQKKIEAHFHELHPHLWVPLYSMVTFSPHITYAQALAIGDIQKDIMAQIMAMPNIENRTQDADVYREILDQVNGHPSLLALIAEDMPHE